jgi:hypothetical protein
MYPILRPSRSKQANLHGDSIGQGNLMSISTAQFAHPFTFDQLLQIVVVFTFRDAEED